MGTALITGASSGLGLEFAWQLAAEGHDVVLVARRAGALQEIAEEIRNVAGTGVEVLPADLATAKGRSAVAARLRAGRPEAAPIGLLVNNAGFGLGQTVIGGDLAKERAGLEVMVRAVLELSHVAANAMVVRGRGAILNVSSATALTAMGTYAAHKAWVRTFTESLASELRGSGVTATALSPGLVHTGFHAASGQDDSVYPDWTFLDAQDVVQAGLDAVRRGQVICTPSVRYKAVNAFLRLAPRALVRRVAGAGLTREAL